MLKTSLERALTYAVVADEIIKISPQLERDQKISQYQKLLDQIDSPEKVGELLLKLEDQKPYFQLCSDEAIADYFSRFQVPITSRKDLDLFAETLAEKVDTLAESNPKVESQVKQRAYLKQLQELPVALSKLEETVSGYGALNKPVAAILRYVWEAVTKYGFRMKEEKKEAFGSNKLICIQSGPGKSVYIKISLDENRDEEQFNSLEFYLNPIFKEITEEKKSFFRKKRISFKKTEELTSFEILPIVIIDSIFIEYQNYYNSRINNRKTRIEECIANQKKLGGGIDSKVFVDQLKLKILECPERYASVSQRHIEILLDLPIIMDNYTKRTTKTLKDILQTSLNKVNEESKTHP